MNDKLVLTPQQLFFLGSVMEAKYIDYAYVSALGIVDQKAKLFESKVKNELSAKGVIKENFSGDVVVELKAKQLLTPLFAGEAEITIDIVTSDNQLSVESYKYHILSNQVTCVYCSDNGFELSSVSVDDIVDRCNGLIPKGYSGVTSDIEAGKEFLKTDRAIAIKTSVLDKVSKVINFIDSDGVLYLEDDNKISKQSAEDFEKRCLSLIREVTDVIS